MTEETRPCECCGATCLPAGKASLYDPDGEWVTRRVGSREYIPRGHGHAFLCPDCSPSDFIEQYEAEHGTRYAKSRNER